MNQTALGTADVHVHAKNGKLATTTFINSVPLCKYAKTTSRGVDLS